MEQRLQKTYFGFLIPAVIGFGFGFLNSELELTSLFSEPAGSTWVVSIFILSLVSAVAAPVMIRTLFAHQQHEKKRVSEADFMIFERLLIRVALISPYGGLVAYLYRFPKFYLAGSFLAALYAVYYFYPSKRRIAFEKRIFRVETDSSS